jgi:hypothetical protein
MSAKDIILSAFAALSVLYGIHSLADQTGIYDQLNAPREIVQYEIFCNLQGSRQQREHFRLGIEELAEGCWKAESRVQAKVQFVWHLLGK